MNKWKIIICSILVIGILMGMSFQALAHPASIDPHKQECKQNVKLTKEQSKTLDALAAKVFQSHKALWEKQAEYKILTTEQVNQRTKFLQKHLEYMKEHHYQWCGKHKHPRSS